MVAKAETVYRLETVSLSYGNKAILRSLSFAIEKYDFVGILGPNGCGKTSLLRLMVGLLKPNQGQVELFGQALSQYSKKKLAQIVSVLPQENPVDFPFSALEVVLMGRAPYLKGFAWESVKDLKIAQEAMEMTDCLQFAAEDIRLLSGGERERVFLARALAQQPQVLLLDEPTTHLDLKHQAEIYRLLQRLHENQKITIIVVLHDLNFASQVCQKVLVLSEQQLAAYGKPETILSPEFIHKIYGVDVVQAFHPENKKLFFLPNFLSDSSSNSTKIRADLNHTK